MPYIATIRERGQITIPDKIRNDFSWLNIGSVVHVIPLNNQTVVVKPYQEEAKQIADWKKIEDTIALVRSFKGKRGNLSEFIVNDREAH